jgi:CheY-like chemotaxis protein
MNSDLDYASISPPQAGPVLGRILVVDDDEGVRGLFHVILSGAGYEVKVARDGAEALAVLPSWKPDVVLMDIVMPNREGIETIREMRRLHANLPIIAMSGAMQSDIYLRLAAVLGAGSTLAKPVSPGELLRAVAAARS